MTKSKSVTASSAVLALALILLATLAQAASFKADPQHSTIGFSVRHLLTKVNGQFREFDASFRFDESTQTLEEVTATIQAASIDTNVEMRDKDLRSKRFFDVERFPTLTFRSTGSAKFSENKARIPGVLSMHGVDREIVLEAEFLGKAKDPWGNVKYGFHASTTIDRTDWGMKWNEVIEAGGVMVGNEVEITLDIEASPES
ncbi:MAG TPA: YceI family protein [Vicinamibacteria bacterium]|nr:YceI family protein [Vicinamibacteria bacterium]